MSEKQRETEKALLQMLERHVQVSTTATVGRAVMRFAG